MGRFLKKSFLLVESFDILSINIEYKKLYPNTENIEG